MGTTETSRGVGGTGAARIRPAQEAVAPPSPAASPSPERGVAQPTASPEARTAWPSVPLTSPAVNRPPGDTPVRVRVRDAVVPDPSPSSPPNEASPAARVDQPGPPRAATPALIREPSLTDLAHPVSASSDGPPSAIRSGGTRILVASPDADHTVSSPAKGDTPVPAVSPGEQALPHPSPTRVRVASPEFDAPAETDAPVTRRRVSEEPLRTAATDTPDNGNPTQDVPVTGAVSPPPVAVFTAVDKTPGEEATPPAGEPATVKPATIPPDVPADAVGGMGDSGGRGNIDTPLAAGFPDPDDESRREGQSAAAKAAAANQPTAGATAVAGEPTVVAKAETTDVTPLRAYLQEQKGILGDETKTPPFSAQNLAIRFHLSVRHARRVAAEEGFPKLRNPKRKRPEHSKLSKEVQVTKMHAELQVIATEKGAIALPSLRSLIKKYPDIPRRQIQAFAVELGLVEPEKYWQPTALTRQVPKRPPTQESSGSKELERAQAYAARHGLLSRLMRISELLYNGQEIPPELLTDSVLSTPRDIWGKKSAIDLIREELTREKTIGRESVPPAAATSKKGLYKQIAIELEQRIRDGLIPLGSPLPRVSALAKEFHVDNGVIFHVHRVLRAKGLITDAKKARHLDVHVARELPKAGTKITERRPLESQRVMKELGADIISGKFRPGTRLPSLPVLVLLYGAGSTMPVVQALHRLERQGFLIDKYGKRRLYIPKEIPKGKIKIEVEKPLYIKTADLLAARIRRGEITLGSQLPPDGELAQQLGVSTSTLKHALLELRIKGYIKPYRFNTKLGVTVEDSLPKRSTRRIIDDTRSTEENFAAFLLTEIAQGNWELGENPPSKKELIRQLTGLYNVGVPTATKAIRILESSGAIKPDTMERRVEDFAELLFADIARGRWGIGEKIPAEPALARLYDVAVPTALQAIELLETSDRVRFEVRRGVGRFITDIPNQENDS